jgi:hypothetical protein
MINCKQATEFVLQQEEGKLSIKQTLVLWQHLAICSLCKRFQIQNTVINNALANEVIPTEPLSAAEKQDLILKLDQPAD